MFTIFYSKFSLSLGNIKLLINRAVNFLFSFCTTLDKQSVKGFFINVLKIYKIFHKSPKNNWYQFLFCCFSQEIQWLGDYWKLIYIKQLRFCSSCPRKISKLFNITSKYFCIFINASPASWVEHIRRDFHTCYSF